MAEIPERYVWAAGILDVAADDRILEIGCGSGRMIPLISARLETGNFVAIDRSPKMVAAAKRIADANSQAFVLLLNFPETPFPDAAFDKIFVYNLNIFWMDPREELHEIGRLLAPGGRFYIFHRPPPEHELEEFAAAFNANLKAAGFEIDRTIFERAGEVNSVCVISRR